MPGRGKRLNSTAKNIMQSTVILRKKVAKNKPKWNLRLTKRTVEATGYSRSTVQRVVAENSVLLGDEIESSFEPRLMTA